MIEKLTDNQLTEMGVAEYHINRIRHNERMVRAIERTKADFALINKILGYDENKDNERIDKIGRKIKNFFR